MKVSDLNPLSLKAHCDTPFQLFAARDFNFE
jgi:hypothetical protein